MGETILPKLRSQEAFVPCGALAVLTKPPNDLFRDPTIMQCDSARTEPSLPNNRCSSNVLLLRRGNHSRSWQHRWRTISCTTIKCTGSPMRRTSTQLFDLLPYRLYFQIRPLYTKSHQIFKLQHSSAIPTCLHPRTPNKAAASQQLAQLAVDTANSPAETTSKKGILPTTLGSTRRTSCALLAWLVPNCPMVLEAANSRTSVRPAHHQCAHNDVWCYNFAVAIHTSAG